MRVVIADDEALARQRLERLVRALPDVELIAVCSTSDEALEVLKHEPVDLALLDIDMPGLDGLELAALLGRSGPPIVFVTAHPEHALAAFGVGARDYVLKPVDADRLARAVDRARPTAAPRVDPLAVPGARGVALIDVGAVTHAILVGESLEIHAGPRVWFSDASLSELERRLPADRFVRVHRRALLALDAVELLRPTEDGGYTACVRGGAEVPVSRAAARALRRRLVFLRE